MTQQPSLRPLDELHVLTSTVQQLVRGESELIGIARHAQLEMARIAVEIGECDTLLNRKEDIQHALLALQMKVQARNKGVFEDLLTSLIHDIMPNKADEKIVFTSSMRNNLAALDVDILAKDGLENVSRDRGGSIANIVAMGLRFVVLARHPNRRVLFLDEADCHLAEMYIPAFAAVMQQLAHTMGIQVVYISHKPAAYFSGYARIIEIYRENDKTHSRTVSDEVLDAEVDYPDSALRYIRLKDFGPHENILVELGPGVNVIIGDNDLGKSKFITAVSELLDNDGSESRIRHHRPHFEVEIGLEEGMTLVWKYARKVGNSRTSLELKDSSGAVIETSNVGKGKIPDWLHKFLAMGRVHGQDIHVHPQDEPKYLLSSRYSSIDRAKMLPLGKESRDVQRMLQQFTQQLSDTRQRRTSLDEDLTRIKNKLKILAPLLDRDEDDLLAHHESLIRNCEKTEKVKKIGVRTANVNRVIKIIREGLDEVDRYIVAPAKLMETQKLGALIENMGRNAEIVSILRKVQGIEKAPQAPVLRDLSGLRKLGIQWNASLEAIEVLKTVSSLQPIPAPAIRDLSRQADLIDRLDKNARQLEACKAQIVACKHQAVVIKDRKQSLLEKLGGICPTCQQAVGSHTHA